MAPVGLLGGVLFVLAIECVVRLIGANWFISYEDGELGRHSTRHHVMAHGSSEVMFVGSSRTHSGVACPEVRRVLRDRLGKEVSVASAATGGAHVTEILPLTRFLLKQAPKPRVIAYGVSPEQIGHTVDRWAQAALFWDPGELIEANRDYLVPLVECAPIVFRNEVEEFWHTLRARGWLINRIRALGGRETSAHPLLGGFHRSHVEARDQRLELDSEAEAEVAEHVKTVHLQPDGSYPSNRDRLKMMKTLVQAASENGVHVLFFELPNADVFERHFPPTVRPEFREFFRGLANGHRNVSFLKLQDAGVQFSNADYRDPVHLNYHGAKRMSKAIAELGILPVFK